MPMMSSEIGTPTTTENSSPPGQQQEQPTQLHQHPQIPLSAPQPQQQTPSPPQSQEHHQQQQQDLLLQQHPQEQQHHLLLHHQHHHQEELQPQHSHPHPHVEDVSTLALVPASIADPADGTCRAVRSSFPVTQNGESIIEVGKEPDALASAEKHYKAAWKDEWVVTLIRLRGSMDEEFNKPQKSGLDMWSRVSSQMSEAHEEFDKNSESCRKKWQRVYKTYKDDKAILAVPGVNKHVSCKWFELIDHYMHSHVDRGDDQEDGDSAPVTNSQHGVHHRSKAITKRVRRDQKIKDSLSRMVETWRESLEVLKDSEAKRLETLQRLSSTMTGLLEILRK